MTEAVYLELQIMCSTQIWNLLRQLTHTYK